MKLVSKTKLFCVVGGALYMYMLFLSSGACAGSRPEHPYRYSVVDLPVSLAAGTVRTPEFSLRTQWYWILLQVERPLPPQQMQCMMGVTTGPLNRVKCEGDNPLLRADWTVWSDGQVAESGSSTTEGDAKFTKENIFKFLGKFPAQAGKKYVLEVKFTKDGTPLNVANPHLIVTKIGDE
jgi:hypothetical protein